MFSATAPSRSLTTPPAQEQQPAVRPQRHWWAFVNSALPNMLIFAFLGGVLYVGHHTGWKMPPLSQLLGRSTEATPDWCPEHLVPESQCVECNVGLLPKHKEFGFCPRHGVAECVICHTELAQVKGKPRLPKYDTAQALALVARPENDSSDSLHKRRIQFTSPESAAKAGIDVDVVGERPMTDAITANGELTFDATRVAHLSSRVAGTVAYVFKAVGDEVRAGETLALVDAAQVGQAKSQLLEAVVQLQLQQAVVKRMRAHSEVLPERTVIDAEAALERAKVAFATARQMLANLGFGVPEQLELRDTASIAEDLRFLGIPPSLIGSLPSGTKTANLLPIRATYDGVLMESKVTPGEVVDATKALFTVADPRRMLLILSVREEDARYVVQGLPVLFRVSDRSQTFAGRVSWTSPAVDQRTRTLQVRVKLDKPDRRLRDRTFGTGRIILREEPNAVVVPREALQSTNDASFVFVRDRNYLTEGAPKVFHVRQIRVGARDDRYVELLAGVLPGEVIATNGSAVLLAQLLRSNLGAGCGCHEH